jgi:hypothetical protein
MKLIKQLTKYKKPVARVLLLLFVFQIGLPVLSYASLTSPGSHTDFWGYQNPNSSQLVGLSNGSLSYTVPIASIPQYPLAIGYNSSDGLNKQAGMFGLGFNGFPGAINRSRMGLPDDLNAGKVTYAFSNQKRWSGSLGATYSIDVMAKIIGDSAASKFAKIVKKLSDKGISTSADVTFKAGYDNYLGATSSLGFGGGLKAIAGIGSGRTKLFGNLGLSGNLNFSSTATSPLLSYNFGGNISMNNLLAETAITMRPSLGFGISGNSDGARDISIGASAGIGLGKGGVLGNSISSLLNELTTYSKKNSQYASSTEDGRYLLPSSPSVTPTEVRTTSASLSYPLGGGFSLNAFFSTTKSGNETKEMTAYGYANLQHAKKSKNVNEITDFTIAGENAYLEGNELNQIPHMQFDNFSIAASGIGGSFRFYQKQYGEVARTTSRSQNRHFSIPLDISTIRHEVYPFTDVQETRFNKNINILELLTSEKNADDKDFDNFFFKHSTAVDFRSERNFGGVELRMVGDLAGNFSPNYSNAKSPLGQTFKQVGSRGNTSDFFLFGAEHSQKIYYPDFDGAAKTHVNKWENSMTHVGEEQTSNIKYYSIGELKQKMNDIVLPDNCPTTETFYNHYQLENNTQTPTIDNLTDALSLKDILSLEGDNKSYFNDLIGGFEVENADGMRYFFTLPVFEKKESSISLKGNGNAAPTDNLNSLTGKDRGKITKSEQFWYPYSWLLTAVVGPNYVDKDNIPGPSDGDLGHWTKFKYVKTSSNYQWRTPFDGMTHIVGDLENVGDDNYSIEYGVKEIYYPYEMESATHISRFKLSQRNDGVEVKNKNQGSPNNVVYGNPTSNSKSAGFIGNDKLYKVDEISLYKKHDSKEISIKRPTDANLENTFKKIRTTVFNYNYELWPGQKNNVDFINNIGNINQHGKLTLKSVQDIVYDKNDAPHLFPAHKFGYNIPKDISDNPIAHDPKLTDSWGNFKLEAKAIVDNKTWYNSYEEVSKQKATLAAKAYKLEQIVTPSGGALKIEYEPKAYASVLGKLPYVMRQMTDIGISTDQKHVTAKVDVTDLVEQWTPGVNCDNSSGGGDTPDTPLLQTVYDNEFHRVDGDKNGVGDRAERLSNTYGEVGFYLESDANRYSTSLIRIQTESEITIIPSNQCPDYMPNEGRYYQEVKLEKPEGGLPFFSDFEAYMLSESPHFKAVKTTVTSEGARREVNQAVTSEKSNIGDALRDLIGNIAGVFKSDKGVKNRMENAFGQIGARQVPRNAFIRTPIFKGKYTSSVVAGITKTDNFNYSTDGLANEYTSKYFYDENFDGTGVATGVCSNEPGVGKANVNDISEMEGAGFHIAPAIYMSKVGVKEGVLAEAYDKTTMGISGHKRGRGLTIHEFYTPDISGYGFNENFSSATYDGGPKNSVSTFATVAMLTFIKFSFKIFGRKITIKLPFILPLVSYYRQKRESYAKSYAYVDKSDIFGKPKAINVMSENGEIVHATKYEYFDPNDRLKVAKGSFNASDIETMRPGVMEENWGESYQIKKTDNSFKLLFLKASSDFNFVRTLAKTTYIPAIVKSVETIDRGRKQTVNHNIFHEYTGVPLETETIYSDGTKKINRNFPAYWEIDEMKPSTKGGTNQFNATSQSISYLGSVAHNNVLQSSRTVFTKDWKITDSYVLNKEFLNDGSFKFTPAFLSGGNFTGIQLVGDYVGKSPKSIADAGVLQATHPIYLVNEQIAFKGEITNSKKGTYNINLASEITLSTNNVYSAHSSEPLEAQNVDGKFITKQLVAGQTLPVAMAGNSPYDYTCYTGGEYFGYDNASSLVLLDNPNIMLLDALHFKKTSCDATTLNADIINVDDHFYVVDNQENYFRSYVIKFPESSNGALFKATAIFSTSGASRVLIFERSEDGTVKAKTNMGEPFDGFFQLNIKGTTQLHFKTDEFNSFKIIDNPVNAEIIDDFSILWDEYKYCFSKKPYQIPQYTCLSDVHTGQYAFYLEPLKQGMVYTIPLAGYVEGKYPAFMEAKVWVHKSAGGNAKLVAKVIGINEDISTMTPSTAVSSVSQVQIKTPEWSLLKVKIKVPDSTLVNSTEKLVFYLDNSTYGNLIFDDFRVNPTGAGWKGTIYDMEYGRVDYAFDDNHFSTHKEYDKFGRVSQIKQEVENQGFVLIQRKNYGFQDESIK